MAADLAGDPRITALSVTDNAGGHARLSPRRPGRGAARAGPRRDRPRRLPRPEPQRHAEPRLGPPVARPDQRPRDQRRLPGRGLRGPVQARVRHRLGGAARAAPRAGHDRGRQGRHRRAPGSRAALLLPRLRDRPLQAPRARPRARSSSSSRSSARSGADYAITQVGYDAHRQDVLLRWMRREGIDMPVVGNAYILAAPVARAFNANRVPGCVVTDDLLALVEREAASPRQGPRVLPRVRREAAGRSPRPRLRGHLHLRPPRRRRGRPGSSSWPTPTRRTTGARS